MAQKGKTKLRDLGKRKESSRAEVKARVNAATQKGQRRLYKSLRLKQKAANERMRQLERAGINSPAYQALQGKLEILGKQKKGDRGRRFSETGKATYNEMQLQMKMLDEFLNQDTSTLKGARSYYDEVWASANANNNLAAAGITREQWFKFWESMPDKKKDHTYGSDVIVTIVQAYAMKNGSLENEGKMSIEDIASAIQDSENYKAAYTSIGLGYKDMRAAKSLGTLSEG